MENSLNIFDIVAGTAAGFFMAYSFINCTKAIDTEGNKASPLNHIWCLAVIAFITYVFYLNLPS